MFNIFFWFSQNPNLCMKENFQHNGLKLEFDGLKTTTILNYESILNIIINIKKLVYLRRELLISLG